MAAFADKFGPDLHPPATGTALFLAREPRGSFQKFPKN
jgi:hypothetical protein